MRRNALLWLSLLALVGCASGGNPSDHAKNLNCAAAAAEVARCGAAGTERSKEECDYARTIASLCAAGDPQNTVAALGATGTAAAAAPIEHGTGFRALGNRSCWREMVSGPQKFGLGNLAVDPWAVAGIPGGDTGELPCQLPEVEAAYEARYVAGCIGDHSPRGGWCSGISNEVRGRAKTALEWACLNRPDMIGSSGTVGGWDCRMTGRDLTDFGAFGNGFPLLLAIEAEMNGGGGGGSNCVPPKVCVPPAQVCDSPKVCIPPPVTCDAPKVCVPPCEVCPLPTCIPPQVKNTACACEKWTLVGWRKARCRAACAWATTLPLCHQ